MALKLFRRKSKAPKEIVEQVKDVLPMVEDKLPDEVVKVEKLATAIFDKQETIEEEGEVTTVDNTPSEEPVSEEAENSDPSNAEKTDEQMESTKNLETSEEESKEQNSGFACCQGSSADVLKNLQAAVGMA